MSKKVFYRYNPATEKYERVYPSKRMRIWTHIRNWGGALILCGIIFICIYLVTSTPREKMLITENNALKQELEILNSRLDASIEVMNEISDRDDNFYRVIMGTERVSAAQRYADVHDDYRYRELEQLPDGELIKSVSQKIDFLDRQLYSQILSFNELQDIAKNNSERLDHTPAIQPLSSENMKSMASGYGYRRDPIYGTSRFHEGLDFAAAQGTPVYATANGKVTNAGWESGYGNLVEIDHGFGYVTRYAHLSKYHVKAGQEVRRGDFIAEVGNTGKSTGSHLHYEVRLHGQPQNPVNYYFMDLTPEEYNDMILKAENAGHVMD